MDENSKKEYPWCPWWHGPHGHWHPGIILLRILIGIIVVVGAFAVGFKLGELKSDMYYAGYSGYNYAPMQYMMNGWNENGYAPGYNYGPYGAPMMRYYENGYYNGTQAPAQQAPTQQAPMQPATSTTK